MNTFFGLRPMGVTLGECAVCKAMRLQEEANEEFKERYGVVNASAPLRIAGFHHHPLNISSPFVR